MSVPYGPTRSGPTRRFSGAITFSSMKMIRKAVGMVITRSAVAASTKRTRGRFAPRKSSSGPSSSATATVRTAPTTSRTGTSTRIAREPSDRRSQYALITTRPSLVHAAHDRVEGGHDRHRVGDQVARHEQPHRLQVEEAGVVDPQAERLVRPVADRVAGVLAARPLDRA